MGIVVTGLGYGYRLLQHVPLGEGPPMAGTVPLLSLGGVMGIVVTGWGYGYQLRKHVP